VSKELEILAEKQDVWIKYVLSFGCNYTTSQDIVSEMYIKVKDYIDRTGNKILYNDKNEPNYFFVYVTLRNMVFDLKRKEKGVVIENIDDYEISNDENIEPVSIDIEKFRVIEDYILDDDYIELNTNSWIDYNPIKFGKFYKRKVFEEIYIKGKSISQFSKDTGITYYSVYNTIKNIKKELQDEYKNRRLDSDHNEMDWY